MKPWVHRASMSGALAVVIAGAMIVEGLVLSAPGSAPGLPPGAAGTPTISSSAGQSPHEPRSPRPRVAVSVNPQPGGGAHLVAERSPSPPQPQPGRSSPAGRPGPSSVPAPKPSPSSDPPAQPSPSTAPPAPKASPVCVVNVLGIKVCLGGAVDVR